MAKKSVSKKEVIKDIFSLAGGVDFLPGSGVVIRDLAETEAPAADPSMPLERNFLHQQLVYWGIDNNYPKRVIETAIASPELLALIDFMVTVLYGDGIGYEIYSGKDGQGNHTWKPGYDEEVEDWMLNNNIQETNRDIFFITKLSMAKIIIVIAQQLT